MIRLMGAEDLSQAEVDGALSRWLHLDYDRHLFTLAAWLAALEAFYLPAGERSK